MPTFIKTGYWDKKAKAPKEWLDLDLLVTALIPPVTGFVPYTGATSAVNLGAYDLTVNGLTVGKGNNGLTNNTVVGFQAGQSFTTGSINTAVGKYALLLTTTGERNVAIGYSALDRNTSGSQNTAIGVFSMYEMQSGTRNIAIGYNAGRGITTGNYNTIIGAQTLSLPASLSNNIILADGQGNIRIRAFDTGNVSINSNTDIPSAQFFINSTTKGFLPPRMTTTEKNAISLPSAGLVVYDLTTNKLCCFNGTIWNDLF